MGANLVSRKIETAHGDQVTLGLLTASDGRAQVLLTVRDVDETVVPTVELSMHDVVELREILRKIIQGTAASEASWHDAA